ncbi:MAG: hypothetical protein PVF56_00870 [Desulfobacterales bacterium]|jgi:hypothetical protein
MKIIIMGSTGTMGQAVDSFSGMPVKKTAFAYVKSVVGKHNAKILDVRDLA